MYVQKVDYVFASFRVALRNMYDETPSFEFLDVNPGSDSLNYRSIFSYGNEICCVGSLTLCSTKFKTTHV